MLHWKQENTVKPMPPRQRLALAGLAACTAALLSAGAYAQQQPYYAPGNGGYMPPSAPDNSQYGTPPPGYGQQYGAPAPDGSQYGAPPQPDNGQYGAPPPDGSQYGAPPQPDDSQYGAPPPDNAQYQYSAPPPDSGLDGYAPDDSSSYSPGEDDAYLPYVTDSDVVLIGGDTFIWFVGPDGHRYRRFYAHGDHRADVFQRRAQIRAYGGGQRGGYPAGAHYQGNAPRPNAYAAPGGYGRPTAPGAQPGGRPAPAQAQQNYARPNPGGPRPANAGNPQPRQEQQRAAPQSRPAASGNRSQNQP
jgi:hypothetical protein